MKKMNSMKRKGKNSKHPNKKIPTYPKMDTNNSGFSYEGEDGPEDPEVGTSDSSNRNFASMIMKEQNEFIKTLDDFQEQYDAWLLKSHDRLKEICTEYKKKAETWTKELCEKEQQITKSQERYGSSASTSPTLISASVSGATTGVPLQQPFIHLTRWTMSRTEETSTEETSTEETQTEFDYEESVQDERIYELRSQIEKAESENEDLRMEYREQSSKKLKLDLAYRKNNRELVAIRNKYQARKRHHESKLKKRDAHLYHHFLLERRMEGAEDHEISLLNHSDRLRDELSEKAIERKKLIQKLKEEGNISEDDDLFSVPSPSIELSIPAVPEKRKPRPKPVRDPNISFFFPYL